MRLSTQLAVTAVNASRDCIQLKLNHRMNTAHGNQQILANEQVYPRLEDLNQLMHLSSSSLGLKRKLLVQACVFDGNSKPLVNPSSCYASYGAKDDCLACL